jgi:hypothetical protein
MANLRVTDGMNSRMDVFTNGRENFGTVAVSVLTLALLSFVIHQFNLLDIAWFSTWLLPISAGMPKAPLGLWLVLDPSSLKKLVK